MRKKTIGTFAVLAGLALTPGAQALGATPTGTPAARAGLTGIVASLAGGDAAASSTVTQPAPVTPAAAQPTPTITQPTATSPTATQPVLASSTVTQPAVSSPTVAQPTSTGSTVTQPAAASSTASQAAVTSSTKVLGTFDISTSAQMAQWASAGGNAVIIPVYWNQAQGSVGGPVSLSAAGNNGDNVITEIQQAHAAGLAVYLEIDLQYAPQFVLNNVPHFVDQGGNAWSSSSAGADVRDWIWSAIGRSYVAAFVKGTLAGLAPVMPDIAGIRAGGGMYGELGYPQDGSTVNGEPSFWGYDAAAQSGTGLAAGESATPLPGYVYGTGTAAQDSQWVNWYLGSLASWIKWYVQLLHSDGWSGPTYVLHPSFGLRTNMAPRTAAYEQQVAYGTDPATMMNAYDQVSNVWPWCTWADDTEPYYYPGDPVASDQSAWRYLLGLAQQRGLAAHIMGENTGGGTTAPIHEMMSGALASGYSGTFYLDYPYMMAMGLESYLVSQFDTYAGPGS